MRGALLLALNWYDARGPFVRKRRYRGFVLYYSRGTFFIDRIRLGGVWEGDTADRMVAELSRHANPTVVDAGANIGLMTLNVLAGVPAARIHAFECGVHQRSLLERTIAANGLQGRVAVYPEALGSQAGDRAFVVHDPAHAALDGFIDTGRAGPTGTTITVRVQTLDGWWRSLDRPRVHIVKIDTEGAELWILEGGRDLLAECRPVLFLEIQRANLAVYPYKARDVLDWLTRHRYGVEAYDGTAVTTENLDRLLVLQENFIARPRSA